MKLAAVCAAIVMLALAAACSHETIVLATVPDDDAGGAMASHHAARCLKTSDCTDSRNFFCQIDKDGDGRCFPRPLSCSPSGIEDFHPVCASGITYFNDCRRKQAGESTSTDGECDDTALRCDVGTACPIGSVCALVSFDEDLPDAPTCGRALGTCWGTMTTCPPPSLTPDRFDECLPKGSPPGQHCLDICSAVQTGRPFTKSVNPQCK
jgi:hypothetical protein